MNKIEMLLVQGAEECGELGQMFSKAARFGIDEVWPDPVGNPRNETNAQRMTREANDLFAVVELLRQELVIAGLCQPNRQLIEEKKKKIEKYMEYSRERGTLTS